MSWNQLTFYSDQQQADAIADYLHELGALAVTLQEGGSDKVFEPLPGETPLWQETQVVGLFDQELSVDLLIPLIEARFGQNSLRYTVQEVADQDWERAWLDEFKPMQFGRHLWIIPSTYAPVDPDAINISMDPGLAFGTGTHATTAMCLEWLDLNRPIGKTLIDYGCGSGILAIAAAKLGAKTIDAVDIDPQAVSATITNAEQNNVANCIKTALPDQFLPKPVDILLANILAKPLISFANSFEQMVKPNGFIVLSGILEEQAEEVMEAYRPFFDIKIAKSLEGWVLLVGVKRTC